MTELKPCPFCGSIDVEVVHCDEVCSVCCDNCEAGYWTGAPGDAESVWNRRVSPWRSLKDDPPVPDAEWKESLRSILVRNPSRDHWYGRIVKLIRDGNTWRDDDEEDTWALEQYIESGCTEWMEVPE